MEILQNDHLQPECDGCPYPEIEPENRRALEIYEAACPWGELDGALLIEALCGSRIRRRELLARVLLIHRLVKKHYGTKQDTA